MQKDRSEFYLFSCLLNPQPQTEDGRGQPHSFPVAARRSAASKSERSAKAHNEKR